MTDEEIKNYQDIDNYSKTIKCFLQGIDPTTLVKNLTVVDLYRLIKLAVNRRLESY